METTNQVTTVKTPARKTREPMSQSERLLLKTAKENYKSMKKNSSIKFKAAKDEIIRAIVNMPAPNWGGISVIVKN
jgi:hypothetical protein